MSKARPFLSTVTLLVGSIITLSAQAESTANEASANFSVGLRLGLLDSASKSAQVRGNTLAGNFNGQSAGVRAAYTHNLWRYSLEYNPAAELTVAGESADFSSTVISLNRQVWAQGQQQVLVGGFVADAEFELSIGPNGVTFSENPTASGITYGFEGEYQYAINPQWSAGAALRLALGEFDGEGQGAFPVDIEIKDYQQVSAYINYHF